MNSKNHNTKKEIEKELENLKRSIQPEWYYTPHFLESAWLAGKKINWDKGIVIDIDLKNQNIIN